MCLWCLFTDKFFTMKNKELYTCVHTCTIKWYDWIWQICGKLKIHALLLFCHKHTLPSSIITINYAWQNNADPVGRWFQFNDAIKISSTLFSHYIYSPKSYSFGKHLIFLLHPCCGFHQIIFFVGVCVCAASISCLVVFKTI